MKFHSLLFTALLCFSVSAFADKATDILDKTRGIIKAAPSVNAEFTLTSFSGTTKTGVTQGNFSMQGQKYTLTTPDVKTWFDGKTQWTYMQGSDEVNVTTPTQEEIEKSSPLSFIDVYKRGFKGTVRNSNLRGKAVWEVTLKAKSKRQPSVIIVDIEKESYTPMCIRLLNDGDWTRIAITDFKKGKSLKESSFQFNTSDHPGVEVIDMR